MIGLSLGTPAGSLQGAELPEVLTPLPPPAQAAAPPPAGALQPPTGFAPGRALPAAHGMARATLSSFSGRRHGPGDQAEVLQHSEHRVRLRPGPLLRVPRLGPVRRVQASQRLQAGPEGAGRR